MSLFTTIQNFAYGGAPVNGQVLGESTQNGIPTFWFILGLFLLIGLILGTFWFIAARNKKKS